MLLRYLKSYICNSVAELRIYSKVLSLFLILHKNIKSNMFMRKIRNFLYFFICSFHLNCPTTEEQITDRQVLLGVTQKVSSNSKHTLLCLCGHNVWARIKPNTIENTSVVSVSLLASIYIEDCLESASHNSYFFVRCKIKR